MEWEGGREGIRRAISQASRPQGGLCSGMQISRLLETLGSQIILSLSAGPQCTGDVMTMVTLATAGRHGAAGCG